MAAARDHLFRHWARGPRRIAALVVAAGLVAAACDGAGDGPITIQLGQDSPDLAPSVDDIESSSDGTILVDRPFATLEGGQRNLSEFDGAPLVINFFAAWCPSCISEMPDFEAVFQDVKEDVAFLGLSQDTTTSAALSLVDETGVTYDVGWDPELDIYLQFGGFAMPTTVFVTADGEVAEVFSGALTANALREKIDAIKV